MLLSGAAGVGMGLFGVALPDIPLFTAMLLKALYETAESFGFDHSSLSEQLYVLRLLETALSDGEDLRRNNQALDVFAQTGVWPETTDLKRQMEAAALLLKNKRIPFDEKEMRILMEAALQAFHTALQQGK